MRQIKPTLRFGRRSDPMMAPGFLQQPDSLAFFDDLDIPYESSQRRLVPASLEAEN